MAIGRLPGVFTQLTSGITSSIPTKQDTLRHQIRDAHGWLDDRRGFVYIQAIQLLRDLNRIEDTMNSWAQKTRGVLL